MKTEKKPYKLHITETFGRNVIIFAEDECEATEIAEELCNNDTIFITSGDDFGDRNVEVIGTPDKKDFERLEMYERQDCKT